MKSAQVLMYTYYEFTQLCWLIEQRAANKSWKCRPISYKRVSLWCLCLDAHQLTTCLSNIGISIREISNTCAFLREVESSNISNLKNEAFLFADTLLRFMLAHSSPLYTWASNLKAWNFILDLRCACGTLADFMRIIYDEPFIKFGLNAWVSPSDKKGVIMLVSRSNCVPFFILWWQTLDQNH